MFFKGARTIMLMNSSCTHFQQCCMGCFGAFLFFYQNTKKPQAVHGFIYLFHFIAVSVCFPVPRDRKRRKGARVCATARVPSIHKTCPVASAQQKGKQCHQVKFLRIPWQIRHLIKRTAVGKDKKNAIWKYIQSASGTKKSPGSVSKARLGGWEARTHVAAAHWGSGAGGEGWNCE